MKLNKKKPKSLFIVGLVLGLFIFGAGCADDTQEGTEETADAAEYNQPVEIGYVLWDGEIASTNVIQQVLQQAGYTDVEIIAVDAGPLYQGVASRIRFHNISMASPDPGELLGNIRRQD